LSPLSFSHSLIFLKQRHSKHVKTAKQKEM
jgi:hypothetical protein